MVYFIPEYCSMQYLFIKNIKEYMYNENTKEYMYNENTKEIPIYF